MTVASATATSATHLRLVVARVAWASASEVLTGSRPGVLDIQMLDHRESLLPSRPVRRRPLPGQHSTNAVAKPSVAGTDCRLPWCDPWRARMPAARPCAHSSLRIG